MTARELIEKLQAVPPDATVVIESDEYSTDEVDVLRTIDLTAPTSIYERIMQQQYLGLATIVVIGEPGETPYPRRVSPIMYHG